MSMQPSAVNLNVPYLHQILSTADNFNGLLAAGPTSMVMVLAAYGLLIPRNDIYQKEFSPFGFYVSNPYTGPTGFYFTRTQPGSQAQGNFAGAYGACLNQSQAVGRLMAEYAINHGLNAQSQPAVWLAVEAELNYGAPVVLATTLKGFGHVVLVKGYTLDGRLIVNDPYWGRPGAGEILYSWADFGLTPFMVTFDQPVPQPVTEKEIGISGNGLLDSFKKNGDSGPTSTPPT